MIRKAYSSASIIAIILTASLPAYAEVATDGTVGRKLRLRGKDVEIGADLSQIQGQNLFHSFERFNVATKGSATFTGPSGLKNVIGRVT